jgi:hypothetical protein
MFMVQQIINNSIKVTGHCMRNGKLSAKGHILPVRNFPAALAEYYIFCTDHATMSEILQTCCSVTGQPDTKMCEGGGRRSNYAKLELKKENYCITLLQVPSTLSVNA